MCIQSKQKDSRQRQDKCDVSQLDKIGFIMYMMYIQNIFIIVY